MIEPIEKPTPNFRRGRRQPVAAIVIHVTEGSATSAASWFNAAVSEVSSHYLVTRAGEVWRFVDEADEAWAQGRVDTPTARVVLDRPGQNPNAYCLSIEHEGTGTGDLTDAQRAASGELIADLAKRHGLPINRTTIIGHREIYRRKACPGNIDLDHLVRTAQAFAKQGAPAAAVPPAPTLVWSDFTQDWLIVTRQVSDSEWYFVPFKSVGAGASRAGVALSTMRRA